MIGGRAARCYGGGGAAVTGGRGGRLHVLANKLGELQGDISPLEKLEARASRGLSRVSHYARARDAFAIAPTRGRVRETETDDHRQGVRHHRAGAFQNLRRR